MRLILYPKIMSEHLTRGLPLEIRTLYFQKVWGSDIGILKKLTDKQQKVLKYYYGLGCAPLQTSEIQKKLGAKSHSLVKMLCNQAENALMRRKREEICKSLGIEPKQDIPLEKRKQYFFSFYGELDTPFDKLQESDKLIYQAYYGIVPLGTKGVPYPKSLAEIKTLYYSRKVVESVILKNIFKIEHTLLTLAHAAIAQELYRNWAKTTQRRCKKCGSTNVLQRYSKGMRNGLRCLECQKNTSPLRCPILIRLG